MTYEQRDNTGALFKNDKQGNDKRPDYRGSCLVDGKELYIAAWLQKSKKGETYMSLKFEEPREQMEPQGDNHNFEDDVPF